MSFYQPEKINRNEGTIDPLQGRLQSISAAVYQVQQVFVLITEAEERKKAVAYSAAMKFGHALSHKSDYLPSSNKVELQLFENKYSPMLRHLETSKQLESHIDPVIPALMITPEAKPSKSITILNEPVGVINAIDALTKPEDPVEAELQRMIKDETAKYTTDDNMQTLLEQSRAVAGTASISIGESNEHISQTTNNN